MLEKELSDKEREYAELEEVWKSEKAALSGSQHIKQALDAAKTEMEQARRAGDLSKMSELQYGRIPELEKQLAAAETGEGKEMSLLRYRVTDEEIAEVLSKATGIPVSKNDGRRERKTLTHGRRIAQTCDRSRGSSRCRSERDSS